MKVILVLNFGRQHSKDLGNQILITRLGDKCLCSLQSSPTDIHVSFSVWIEFGYFLFNKF